MRRRDGQKNEGLDCTESATLLRDLQGPLGDDRRQNTEKRNKKRGEKNKQEKKNRTTKKGNGKEMGENRRTAHGREPFRDCIIMAWTICPHGPHLDDTKRRKKEKRIAKANLTPRSRSERR